MEQLDLEQPGGRVRSRVFNRNGGSPCGRPLITLRKYSPVICLVELATIALFVYLLVFHAPNSSKQQFACTQANQQLQPHIFTWANETGTGKQLVTGLIEHCHQRKHDYQMSVQCRSNRINSCGPVETKAQDDLTSDQSAKVAISIVSSKKGDRLARRTVALKEVQCGQECRFKTKVEVDSSNRGWHQKIIGWGGALTDSSLNNILSLSTNGTRQLLQDYFGPDGLMYNIVRITIGGSDFSPRFYTNDDSATDDLSLSNFTLREEDILYKIPTLKLLQERFSDKELLARNDGGIKLFASMWSPPVWMKTNKHFNQGQLRGYIDDEPITDPKHPPESELFYNALAELKVKFIKSYQKEGIRFWGLTVMNEPLFAVQPFLDYNTMIFPKEDYANYVAKYLGPKIKNDPSLSHIKLMAHDDNRRFLVNFTWPLVDQKGVRQYLDGVAVHSYADEAYHMMNTTWERYRDDHDLHHHDDSMARRPADSNFFVLSTELCSGHLPFMAKALIGNWHRGVHYALDVIRSLQNAAAGWVDWNMALDLEGGPGWLGGRLDAPIIVDKAQDLYHKSPMFYVLGQFSRYIPPGSVRLETKVEQHKFDHEFEVVAFLLPTTGKAERKLAIVAVNNNPYPVDIYLKVRGEQQQSPSAAHLVVPCPADSVQTVLY